MDKENQNNLSQKYNRGTIIVHWATTIVILALFPVGKYMAGIESSEKMGLIKIHIAFGNIAFILTIIRSWMYFKKTRPTDLKTGSRLNDKLIIWIHSVFYFLLFGISISGIGTVIFGGYGSAIINGDAGLIKNSTDILPLKGHGIMALILMILLVVHVLGVIKHYLTTKENALKRIF
jgi:cytochrome b561